MTTLVKRENRYDLYGNDGSKIASSAQNPFGKLSKENCDDLFEVIDVEKVIEQTKQTSEDSRISSYESFKIGFNIAMDLNKDKLFTVEDVKKAIVLSMTYNDNTVIKLLQRQSIELEVEIEMLPYSSELTESEVRGFEEHAPNSGYKLDGNGCLILRKK